MKRSQFLVFWIALGSGVPTLAAAADVADPTGPKSFNVLRGTACPPEYAYRRIDGQPPRFVCEARPAETERKPGWPVALPLDRFGKDDRETSPLGTPLTAQEEQRLLAAAATFDLPAYVYSGCHDRAHAAYMLLPLDLRDKVMKVWVVAPKAYTIGVGGSISLASAPEGLPNVRWGYHVALAYTGPKGIRLLDPSLAPKTSLSLDAWFQKLRYPSLTFWTLTEGAAYLFFPENNNLFFRTDSGDYVPKDTSYMRNSVVWTGNYHKYEGKSVEDRFIPEALARDEIGVRGLKGEGCNTVKALAVEPVQLLRFLREGGSTACQDEVTLFNSRMEHWANRLK